MNPTMAAVVRATRDLLTAYLACYPEDAARLVKLHDQLEMGKTDILVRSTMAGHITTSIVVFDPVSRKVLLIYHGIYKDWMPSGGHFELDVSLWLSALRELFEETGVVAEALEWRGVGSAMLPIDIDTHPIPANPKKGEGAHFHHDFTFVATASSSVPLVPQVEEVDEVDWVHLSVLHNSPLERVRRLGARIEEAYPVEVTA
jgi:8-oxo-dGTP pyrophosphatase MutT (NUDIX family)